jgi:hypothetical protein
MIGGQVGIAGHLTWNNVRIQAQSGVGRNVKVMKSYKEVQHLDIMIIVSLTYTLKLTENRCRIRRIKTNIKPKRGIMVKQKTIKTEISLTGVGLHTGKEVIMTFKPAPSNNGFTFVRVDLEGHPVVEADANYVVNTQRGTNLEKLGKKIQTPNMF